MKSPAAGPPPAAPTPKRRKPNPRYGTHVIWPVGLEERYGISLITRWRWERDGKLPPRDINIAGHTGWLISTIEAAERGALNTPPRPQPLSPAARAARRRIAAAP